MVKPIKNIKLATGDSIEIEHTCVDRREYIQMIVCFCSIDNGKGVAVFNDELGRVYLWKPTNKEPHGKLYRVDSVNDDYLVNPYVRALHKASGKLRPVDSRTGSYLITVS